MSTTFKVKHGSTEECISCGAPYNGGEKMIRLTSLSGERLGNCCLYCYELDEEEMEEKWG